MPFGQRWPLLHDVVAVGPDQLDLVAVDVDLEAAHRLAQRARAQVDLPAFADAGSVVVIRPPPYSRRLTIPSWIGKAIR